MNTKFFFNGVLITSLIVLLLTSGCLRDIDNSIPYSEISEEFADYCWFEIGSYWVFQNDSTLLTDTVKIDNLLESSRLHNQGKSFNYQAIELFLANNSFNISKYELTAGSPETTSSNMNSLLRLYKDDGSYHLVFLPQYAVGEVVNMGVDIGNYTNIEILESYVLNSKTYHNVYHTRVVIPSKDSEYNYWIAKNHGIIKAVSTINEETTSISVTDDYLMF